VSAQAQKARPEFENRPAPIEFVTAAPVAAVTIAIEVAAMAVERIELGQIQFAVVEPARVQSEKPDSVELEIEPADSARARDSRASSPKAGTGLPSHRARFVCCLPSWIIFPVQSRNLFACVPAEPRCP
jgi:hypothetical protein